MNSFERVGYDGTPAATTSLNVTEIVRVLGRRKSILLLSGIAGALLGTGISAALPSKYMAQGALVVRSQAMTADDSEKAFDSNVVNEAVVTTETQILTSNGLLGRVAASVSIPPHELNNAGLVNATREQLEQFAKWTGWPLWLVGDLEAFAPETPLSEADKAERQLKFVSAALTVLPTKGSSVIDVRATTSDPRLSASIANTLMTFYMQERSSEQSHSAELIETALRERLNQSTIKIREGEANLLKLLEQPGVVEDSDVPGAFRNISLIGPQLLQAEAELARRRVEYEAAVRGGIGAKALTVATPESLALQRQLTDLQQVLGKVGAYAGPNFPARKAIQEQINTLQDELNAEVQRGIQQRREAVTTTAALVASLRQKTEDIRSNRVTQSSAIVGLSRQRETLAGLGRMSDALQLRLIDLAARVSNPNARILGLANVPARPAFPSKQMFALVGFSLVTLLSAALILWRAHQKQVRPLAIQLAHQLGTPLLGSVPRLLGSRSRMLPAQLGNRLVDRRGLDETLQALALELELIIKRDSLKCVMVTSAFVGEGKTTVTVLLGRYLAACGMRVLLIDLDLRSPFIERVLGKSAIVLQETERYIGPHALVEVCLGNVVMHVLTPFAQDSDGVDPFLRSTSLRNTVETARQNFDLILIDTAPVMAVPDALQIARMCDTVVIVSELGRSPKATLDELKRRLAITGKPICGVVVTKVDNEEHQAGTYSGYGERIVPKRKRLARYGI